MNKRSQGCTRSQVTSSDVSELLINMKEGWEDSDLKMQFCGSYINANYSVPIDANSQSCPYSLSFNAYMYFST